MKKRHSAEQIVAKLRQADVELGKGLKVPEVCLSLPPSDGRGELEEDVALPRIPRMPVDG